MACKDCIHEKLCIDKHYYDEGSILSCEDFKNKADFVEVVRCKDCDVPHNKWTGCPKLNGLIPPPNYYCAGGERKVDAGDGS